MKPSEHKTVQARILAYTQEVEWTLVSREEAEKRRDNGDSTLEIGGRRKVSDSESLSSLRSLRLLFLRLHSLLTRHPDSSFRRPQSHANFHL